MSTIIETNELIEGENTFPKEYGIYESLKNTHPIFERVLLYIQMGEKKWL